MAKAITSPKFQVKEGRASFLKIDEKEFFNPAAPGPNEKKKYRATVLLDPTVEAHAKLIKSIEKWEAKIIAEVYEGKKPKTFESCYGYGNDLDKVYDGYKDMFFLKLATADEFPTVGRRKNADGKFIPLRPGAKEWPYNGCYVNVSATLWNQNSHGRKAINGNLLAIQFVKDGAAFGRPPADADSEFDALPDGEGESAFDEKPDDDSTFE